MSPRSTESDRARAYAAVMSAYATWRSSLAHSAEDVHLDPSRGDVLDLTNIHPTGAAQFYSGTPTPLTSLFRESESLASARLTCTALLDRVRELEESYGSAPVSLILGTLTWSELVPTRTGPGAADPANAGDDDEVDLGEPYDLTGELHLSAEAIEAYAKERSEADREGEPAGEDGPEEGQEADDREAGDSRNSEQDSVQEAVFSASPEDVVRVVEMREPALRRDVRVVASTASDAVLTLGENTDVSATVIEALRRHGAPADAVEEVRTLAREEETRDEAQLRLRELGRLYLPGCSYTPSILLGLASSPSDILLGDLEAMEPQIRGSQLISRIVEGDKQDEPIAHNPRDRAPSAERGAGFLDVAELDIVDAVAAGRSLFIDTAPGTDPYRVLASLAADHAASGRSVLYVSGRASAQQAFERAMEELGLGEAVVNFSRTDDVPLRLRSGLRLKSDPVDREQLSEANARLETKRSEIETVMTALHETHPRWQVSAYDLLGRIVELSLAEDGPRPRVRLSEQAAAGLGREKAKVRAAENLSDMIRLRAKASADNPWRDSKISDAKDAEAALTTVTHLADIALPALADQAQRAAAETGLKRATTIEEWGIQLELLTDIADTLDVFRPQIYERSATDLVSATASKEWRAAHGVQLSRSQRRHLRRDAKDMVRPGQDIADLHAGLVKVQSEREKWKALAEPGSWPELPEGVRTMRDTFAEVSEDVTELARVLPEGEGLEQMSFADLRRRCQSLAREAGDLELLPRVGAVTAELSQAGLLDLAHELIEREVAPERVADELDAAYLASVFEQMFSQTPELAAIAGTRAVELVREVTEADREHMAAMPSYISHAIITAMRRLITRRQGETLRLDRHLEMHGVSGLREAISAHGAILTASRPVWLMNAVAVAQHIPPMEWADLVILDGIESTELAQVVPSLLRGSTVVVTGNARRPSPGATEALAGALPVATLPTHASHHDEVTAHFLAEAGFAEDLSIYPGPPSAPSPRLIVVDGTGVPGRSGLVEAPEAEVAAVVDQVVDIALTHPGESIGVISLNEVHAERIRTQIRQVARTSSALEELTDPTRGEPFTVVDVATCTGLRRDHIVLTVGLGKTVHGRVLHSFGVVGHDEGLRGLVAALEAPRRSLTVISSFEATDIDRSRLTAPGAILLVDLLAAYRKPPRSAAGEGLRGPSAALLEDLALRLTDRGYLAETGYGRSDTLRIPLVAGHPDLPGGLAVAVTIDDERYAAEPSLRRRDGFWPAMLAERGWKVVPTFTTAAFFNPNSQVDAIVAAIDELRDENRLAVDRPAVRPLPAHLDVTSLDEDLEEEAPAPRQLRGPRPKLSPGMPLAAYSDDQLDELVAWIASDGAERTEDEMVEELRSQLDLRRRGVQIDLILRNVVRRSRS